MIQLRSDGSRLVPILPRLLGRVLVLAVTILSIALFAWNMRPASYQGAVMRVSLADVPEERVVEFGHELGTFAAFEEEGVERLADAEVPSGGPAAATDPVPDRPLRLAAAQPAAKPVKPDANGVLPIGFSLSQGVSSEKGGVGVPKQLASGEGNATGLTIFLIGGAVIEVDRNELVAALARLGAQERVSTLPDAGENGRLTLDRVRTAGLDLRYDAISDRLVLRP